MEGEFGDRFHKFFELLVLDDWLDVVRGAKHLYPTVQCDFKLALEHACHRETLSATCVFGQHLELRLSLKQAHCFTIRLRRSVYI